MNYLKANYLIMALTRRHLDGYITFFVVKKNKKTKKKQKKKQKKKTKKKQRVHYEHTPI